MAYLQSHQELKQHPKTKRMARMLGVSVPAAIGHLHCLWWWALDYAQDGDLFGYSNEDIAEAALWDGEPTAFVTALLGCGVGNSAGFLEARDGARGFIIHDWWDYAGKLIERRKADAERKRTSRQQTDMPDESTPLYMDAPQDVPQTSTGQRADGARRVEKSRVDKSNDHAQNDDALFDTFWESYPRKVGKQAARQAWDRCLKHGYEPQQLITAAANYAQATSDANTEAQYILHGSTFLGPQRRWEDFRTYISTAEPPIDYEADRARFVASLESAL